MLAESHRTLGSDIVVEDRIEDAEIAVHILGNQIFTTVKISLVGI